MGDQLKAADECYCRSCGAVIKQEPEICPKCGVRQRKLPGAVGPVSSKDIIPAAVLCFFLGWLGIHRFYVGKSGTGVLMILTVGGCGIWALIDFIMIVVGNFTDKEGKFLKWNQ
jgi:hypothetical protein